MRALSAIAGWAAKAAATAAETANIFLFNNIPSATAATTPPLRPDLPCALAVSATATHVFVFSLKTVR